MKKKVGVGFYKKKKKKNMALRVRGKRNIPVDGPRMCLLVLELGLTSSPVVN